MGTALASVGAITLFVADPERSKRFYETLFGRPPVFEDGDSAAFRLDNLLVNVLRSTAAGELVTPAAVGAGDDGARFQLTVRVEDADAACAELERLGVELLNGPLDRAWGVRTAAFADPDGHVWEVAQPLDG